MEHNHDLEGRWGESRRDRRFAGPGGTSGGLGSFLLGMVLSIAGAYLIMNQVIVTSGYWMWWGANTFGMTLVPLILGIGLLFFDGRSPWGWFLAVAGVVIIFAGILANVHIYLRASTLFDFLVMVTLFVGGLGLMARALKGQ